MGKCYLCGKRVWRWQRRAWHSDSWGFVLLQDMGDDAHLFRVCHETCVKDKLRAKRIPLYRGIAPELKVITKKEDDLE